MRNTAADVVVIGAGLIGLSIAFELAQRGAGVRVIETAEPAKAASWAGAGMLAPYTEAVAPGAFEALCVDSLARYPAFVAELIARGGIDPHLRLDGIVEIAFDRAAELRLRARAETLSARGTALRFCERDELRTLEPSVGAAARGGLLSAAEGCVDNRRLGRALLAACDSLGVNVDGGSGEITVEADTRRVLGVRGGRGFVAAQSVINAAGAWAGELAGIPEHVRVRVEKVKGQMLALAMPRGFVRRPLWVPGAYLVPRDDGRLLVGATVEPGLDDHRVTAAGLHGLLDAAIGALPALRDLAVVETWAGLRPGTPDGLPYIGATDLGGYFVAAGHYRNGILLAPATAGLMADVVSGRPGIAAFSPGRGHGARAVAAKGSA